MCMHVTKRCHSKRAMLRLLPPSLPCDDNLDGAHWKLILELLMHTHFQGIIFVTRWHAPGFSWQAKNIENLADFFHGLPWVQGC